MQWLILAVAIVVERDRRRGVARGRRLAGNVTTRCLRPLLGVVVPELVQGDAHALGVEDLLRLLPAVRRAARQVRRAVEGAGDDVELAIRVEVHELWHVCQEQAHGPAWSAEESARREAEARRVEVLWRQRDL